MTFHITFVLGDFPHFAGPYNGSFAHGIASMTAVLRQAGYSVSLLHLTQPPSREEFLDNLLETRPNLIAISTITHMFPHVEQWAQWSREGCAAPIIVGGIHAILRPDDVATTPDVDYVCSGEGEFVLLELCRALEAGRDAGDIQGLWARLNGNIYRNPQRPLIADINELPMPDYSIFDYEKINRGMTNRFSVMVSRGCQYRCSYCANQKIKNSYPNPKAYTRFYTPDRAIEILEHLSSQYPTTKEVIFNDNILYQSMEWLRDFAEAYRDRINLPFTANTRPNLVNEEVVELMTRAGCQRVCMGVENGDERIANRVLRRGQNNKSIRKAFRLFRNAGVKTVSYNIVGSPFETMESMVKTVRLNADLRPTMISPFIYYPFPETESYDLCAENGFLTEKHGTNNIDMVMIHQPTVSDAEVLFMHRFFRPLVRTFELLATLPTWLRMPGEKGLSLVLNADWLPFGFLSRLRAKYESYRFRRFASWSQTPRPGPPDLTGGP